jgi:hypothetical protein
MAQRRKIAEKRLAHFRSREFPCRGRQQSEWHARRSVREPHSDCDDPLRGRRADASVVRPQRLPQGTPTSRWPGIGRAHKHCWLRTTDQSSTDACSAPPAPARGGSGAGNLAAAGRGKPFRAHEATLGSAQPAQGRRDRVLVAYERNEQFLTGDAGRGMAYRAGGGNGATELEACSRPLADPTPSSDESTRGYRHPVVFYVCFLEQVKITYLCLLV